MSGWTNSRWGALGEPMSDHLEPPEGYDCDYDEEEGDYTPADAAMDEAIDELEGIILEGKE